MKKLMFALMLGVASLSFMNATASCPSHHPHPTPVGAGIPFAFAHAQGPADAITLPVGALPGAPGAFVPLTFDTGSFINKSAGNVAQTTASTFTLQPGSYLLQFWGQFENTSLVGVATYNLAFFVNGVELSPTRASIPLATLLTPEYQTTSIFGVVVVPPGTTSTVAVEARDISLPATLGTIIARSRAIFIEKLK